MSETIDSQGLRGFLSQVERHNPDQLLRIGAEVSTHLDITSTVLELERHGRSPVVVFDNVKGHTMPVVTNVAGNRTLLAAALGADPANLPSPSYLTDDVQYYAPGPEYHQAMEEAKLKAENEAHAAEQDR